MRLERDRDALLAVLTIACCPITPTVRQADFLRDMRPEALYGGAAGGGKSTAMLMAALQFIEVPGYHALILRRTLAELTQPNGLLAVSQDWLTGRARFVRDSHQWVFPNGSTLSFGHLDTEFGHHRYQGGEYHFVGFDELTHFERDQYLYLFSRQRGPAAATHSDLASVPIRMRATTNPGGPGHPWVRRRFVVPFQERGNRNDPHADIAFYPATIDDNPHINQADYDHRLLRLGTVEREQLRHGDWDIRPEGRLFDPEWFEIIRSTDLPDRITWVRAWDLAATEKEPGKDPDWTVGMRVGHDDKSGLYFVRDVARRRTTPNKVLQMIAAAAEADGRDITIWVEEEGGSAGQFVIDDLRRNVVPRYRLRSKRPTGSKLVRAQPVAGGAEAGDVKLVAGPWNDTFLDELSVFPDGAHDDQVDALSLAIEVLAGEASRSMRGVTIPQLLKPEDEWPPSQRGW